MDQINRKIKHLNLSAEAAEAAKACQLEALHIVCDNNNNITELDIEFSCFRRCALYGTAATNRAPSVRE